VKKKKGKHPKPDLRRRKSQKSVHAHDDFEIQIDAESEITAVDEPRYTGESIVTDEPHDPLDEEPITQEADLSELDIELPESSEDEVLPIYVSSKKHPKPTSKQDNPTPSPPEKASFPRTPLSTSDKEDILNLFDDPQNASLTTELPPAHDTFGPSMPEPDEFEIARPGEKTGMLPLDSDLFDSHPPLRKKKGQKLLGPVIPAPMAHSEQIVKRRFHFTLRDLVLLILVLVFAAGLALTWIVYQNYRERENLKDLDRGHELIEKSKTDAIQHTTKNKDEDIPYQDKIERKKESRSPPRENGEPQWNSPWQVTGHPGEGE
jgi:hypothetical protein